MVFLNFFTNKENREPEVHFTKMDDDSIDDSVLTEITNPQLVARISALISGILQSSVNAANTENYVKGIDEDRCGRDADGDRGYLENSILRSMFWSRRYTKQQWLFNPSFDQKLPQPGGQQASERTDCLCGIDGCTVDCSYGSE